MHTSWIIRWLDFPAKCEDLITKIKSSRANANITVYENARHSFDRSKKVKIDEYQYKYGNCFLENEMMVYSPVKSFLEFLCASMSNRRLDLHFVKIEYQVIVESQRLAKNL